MSGPGAPRDVIASNDPKELAQYHARVNHLVLDTLNTMLVGGVQCPAALFHGMVGKPRSRSRSPTTRRPATSRSTCSCAASSCHDTRP